jgi:Flp pilus assembly protein TadD
MKHNNGFFASLAAIGFACFALSLSGCQSTSQQVSSSDDVSSNLSFSLHWQSDKFNQIKVIEPDEILALTPDQKAEFLSYFNSDEQQGVSPNFRISNFLDKWTSDFSYSGDTFTAREAFEKKSGNCLTLAILTTALANVVGLDVYYKKVFTPPIYRRHNHVLTTSAHVKTIVLGPEPEEKKLGVVFFRSRTVIDYFPSSLNDTGEYVAFNDFISMYYQNKVAKAMAANNSSLVYSLLSTAMLQNPLNSETLNALAVFYRQNKLYKKARVIYEFAIENNVESIHTLSNYAFLLSEVGDTTALAQVESQLLDVEENNPYQWYDQGVKYLNQGETWRAVALFNKSVKTGPYLSEGYMGLAKAYFLLGDVERAESKLKKAKELAYGEKERGLYAAKLDALQRVNRFTD